MKLFLFDLDWTLIYTGGAGVRALNVAFEKHFGIANAMKTLSPDGKTDPAIVREMIRVHLRRDPEDGEIESICRAYVDRLKIEVATSAGYRVLPGVPELLESLSKRSDILVGLGTGNLEEGARIKLSRPDLMKYFRFGGYSSDSEDRSEVLAAAVRRGEALAGQAVAPRDVFVLGDNWRDIEAGQAIGASTVGVATGPVPYEELAKHRPDYLFRDFSDTQKVLQTLLP
jgi:phosphoglycolate phosphatase-like HAD superfamily hydrolase